MPLEHTVCHILVLPFKNNFIPPAATEDKVTNRRLSVMIFLILAISFNLLSTGNLQELNDANNYNLPQPNLGGPIPVLADQWPVQTIQTVHGNFFGQAFRNINSKPCSSRRNLQDLNEQWIPTFSSKIIRPITNFDTLNAQEVKEENNGENYTPLAPLLVEDNVPTVLDNDAHNLITSRSSLLFDDRMENVVEDPIDVQGELMTEDRSVFDEDRFPLVNNEEEVIENHSQDDKSIENTENYDEKKIADNEPESESKRETEKVPDECMNKKMKTNEVKIMGDSRRSMSRIENQESSLTGINVNAENYLNDRNNLDSQVNSDDKEDDKNKIAIIMRKATPTKSLINVKRPLQDSTMELLEPTKGSGISELSESRMMLMDHSRLCYACSTASNPTCWAPDRKTTVKYCLKGHEACVTKTFQTGKTLTLVRDCGNSCEDVDIPGFVPKYKSCSICHSDLCNGAYAINSHNIIFAFVLMTVIKCIY